MIAPLPPLLLRGDCLVELARIPDGSVDSVVCDPPYGLEFMGKAWDKYTPLDFELWCAKWAAECLRILKPGGHMLAFGGSRTWHRLAAGIEDAGFEIRDSIAWLYSQGFPKSMNVSKAIDKAAGAQREVVGRLRGAHNGSVVGLGEAPSMASEYDATAAATDAAREWEGWGTALKPAFEPVVVARKPLGEKTVAANVLAHGTGALSIDATRIGTEGGTRAIPRGTTGKTRMSTNFAMQEADTVAAGGRWPANVVLDESQATALDEQSGTLTSGANPKRRGADKGRTVLGEFAGQSDANPQRGVDTGGASRFFYVAPIDELEERFIYGAKAPKSERPVVDGVAHPTVKSLKVMRWLCRLVTPPGGVVVDPFAGSGTTLEAAYLEGFESIGVEMTPEYWPLIAARIERVTR